jgi:hypothetical protein
MENKQKSILEFPVQPNIKLNCIFTSLGVGTDMSIELNCCTFAKVYLKWSMYFEKWLSIVLGT